VHLDTADAPAVLVGNVADVGNALDDLAEGLVGVLFLVEADNVRGAHRLVEGSVEHRDDTREPRGDGRHERERKLGVAHQSAEVRRRLTLVDVVGERVRADRAVEVGVRLQLA